MEREVFSSLGHRSRRTRVGPGIGLDNAILGIGEGRVMILTVDPVSAIPAIGPEKSAWLSVHLIASDYTTSGTRPEFATFSYNFPESMSGADAAGYVRSVGKACRELGVAIVAGHTGSYPGADYTVIGAGTMLGLSEEGRYVDPTGIRAGDLVLMTKHAAIEATFSLALSFPQYTREHVGRKSFKEASSMTDICSTVDDALAAAETGLGPTGVTSMHDATEGGVLGALREMSEAANKAIVAEVGQIPVSQAARDVCAAFGIDPLTSLGEGALLVTCRPERVSSLEDHMRRSGIEITRIGSVRSGSGLWLSSDGGPPRLARPRQDGYWRAYSRWVSSKGG